MSANSYEYKLLGFSPELDWRPLRFVSPLPPAMICSVCRLVHRTTCYLLCGHLLCKRCYHRCRVDDALVCPLDSNVCPEDDVLWRNFPLESLARVQVQCWNEASGCNFTAAASDIARHYQQDCEYHVINCPKCARKMWSSDLYTHVRSCDSLAELSAVRARFEDEAGEQESLEGSPQATAPTLHDSSAQDNRYIVSLCSQVKAMNAELGRVLGEYAQDAVALKAVMEDRTNEMKRELEALSSSYNDRLCELERNVTTLKDSLDTERNHTKEQIKRGQKIAAEFKKKSEGHAAEFTAFNKKLQVLNAKVDQLCVRTNLHTGVVERFSNFLNVIEGLLKEQMDEAASRGGVGGSAGNAAVAVRNILGAVESRDIWPNQITEAKHGRNVPGELDTLKVRFDTHVDSMQTSLEELSAQNKVINDRLNSLCNSIHVLEDWKDSTDQSESPSKAAFTQAVAENAASEGTLSSILTIVQKFGTGIKSQSWVLKGIKALKKKATKAGEACHMSEKVYLRGYCVSPGVVIKEQRGSLWLHFCLQVHKGVMDDDLRWPFDHEAKFSIIHPKDHQQREIHVDCPNSASLIESRGKRVMNFATSSFDLSFLEKKEYIKDNQLILKLELLASG